MKDKKHTGGCKKGCKGHTAWNKGLTKEGNEILMRISEKNKKQTSWIKGLTKETNKSVMAISKKNKNQVPWHKGLTKETDERVKAFAEKLKGKKRSKEVRKKISKNSLKQFENGMPEKTKEKLRISAIKRIERQRLNGMPLTPCIGKYEKSVLDILENNWGYKIERQKPVAGYFLDGYCPMLNLAIAIDEPHHLNQIDKDKVRQNNIEDALGCSFLRIEVSV